jgi:transposase
MPTSLLYNGWGLKGYHYCQKRFLRQRFSKPKLNALRQIAIDEISVGKGRQYLTVVMDLDTGAVVFVGEGNDAKALDPFWRRLRSSRAHIDAVAMDMFGAYIRAVSRHLPRAAIVFDHFHVIKLFNDKFQDLRRQLFHKAQSEMEKKVIKGTRWLLLKNPENLVPDRDEPQRLRQALEFNQPLATAY